MHKCTCVLQRISERVGSAVEGKVICVCVCVCMPVCLSPGQGDTGISRDELLIEEAVIEVFKKVRGD